jgi:hypothetical protein
MKNGHLKLIFKMQKKKKKEKKNIEFNARKIKWCNNYWE